jgi:hypothetical protein
MRPSLQIKSFVTVGGDLTFPTGPLARFLVREAELDLLFRPASWLSFIVAFHYLDGVTNASGFSLLESLLQRAVVLIESPHGASVTFGKFFAFQGWESENTLGRYAVTGSHVYRNTPSTHTGLVLHYGKTWKKASLGADLFFVNNWDSNQNNTFYPSVGLNVSATWNVGAVSFGWNVTAEYGTQPGAVLPTLAEQGVFSINSNLQVTFLGGRLFVLGDGMLLVDPSSGKQWFAAMGMVHMMFTPWIGMTARFSHLEDGQRLQSLLGVSTGEFTLALIVKPLLVRKRHAGIAAVSDMQVMLEGRTDVPSYDISNAAYAIRLSLILPFSMSLHAKGR